MKKLLQGIRDFRKNNQKQYRAQYSELIRTQSPDALLLACSDSRLVPNMFTGSEPGNLFIVRNIGNLVPPYHNVATESCLAAAIEYAVCFLHVADIIICGHSECGAMQALMEGSSSEQMPHLREWLKYGLPSCDAVENSPLDITGLSQCNALSQINVLQQIEHIKTYPLVAEAVCKGLTLHAWWFDLKTADVYEYNAKHNKFMLMDIENIHN